MNILMNLTITKLNIDNNNKYKKYFLNFYGFNSVCYVLVNIIKPIIFMYSKLT